MASIQLFLYAFLAGILPSLLWLFFFTREDSAHNNSRRIIFGCFIGGALAVIIAIFAEKIIADAISDPSMRYILWATFEEVVKFIVAAVIIFAVRANEDPVDAMIYCASVALGFAAIENTLFILGPLSQGSIVSAIITTNMRFIGATLVHVVSSSLVGFMVGYFFYYSRITKIVAAFAGLAGAIALHATFNLSIINASSLDTLKAFGWIWGAVVILIILFEEVKAVHPKYI
ncbi:MAG TPA: PrsW family glutamic-type intramembrane protease [Candidatus Paceibacterota bacterium]|jgi:RsiW-degrading membrane proteinase PrsW (M82 family)|nr:PrsW family glutamic-type intramembrane protease [Candidatus Paceibacterota bacterium]